MHGRWMNASRSFQKYVRAPRCVSFVLGALAAAGLPSLHHCVFSFASQFRSRTSTS